MLTLQWSRISNQNFRLSQRQSRHAACYDCPAHFSFQSSVFSALQCSFCFQCSRSSARAYRFTFNAAVNFTERSILKSFHLGLLRILWLGSFKLCMALKGGRQVWLWNWLFDSSAEQFGQPATFGFKINSLPCSFKNQLYRFRNINWTEKFFTWKSGKVCFSSCGTFSSSQWLVATLDDQGAGRSAALHGRWNKYKN